ncbi:response regulator [Paenibacillus campinasensis]|uniref:Response regulator n=1 Tax=Paenibacillus campinasensis TaxID=66347 RepID=A0ABW9SYP9_9BACL|nr:response regulator transcription factor [Paenibacillus campinasensis]MUG64834.1 response regulator [Paenibacillus campinasensis]
MSQATLQRVQATDLYDELEQEGRQHRGSGFALMFLYSADRLSEMKDAVRGYVEQLSASGAQVREDAATRTLAVTLPGYSLDAAHYEALLLKQLLEEQRLGEPRITLAALTEPPASSVIKQMAEATRLSTSSDIYIYTEQESERGRGRILIVDQDASVREFLHIRLAMQGYETLQAADGLEALDLIAKWEPDLMITELNLHGIDGLPFIHHIQQLAVKHPPKIVVLTEKRVEQTISQCFESGVDDYVTKPFSPVELDARIRRCLQ